MNLTSRLEAALSDGAFSLLRLIASEATRRGLTLYTVGGLPRDLFLRRLTRDLDLVLESDAIPFARALARAHGGRVAAHPAFHTAIWFLPSHLASDEETPETIDLISARSETYAHPAALPTVILGNLKDDLRRRDFSINTLAIRLNGIYFGELVDPFNGMDDLKKGRMRVLHPRSFVDDPTRIFRAVRYAGRYGFKLASATADLIPDALAYVDKLSPERLRHELDLILAEPNAADMLARLSDLGLLAAVLPTIPAFDSKYAKLLGKTPPAEFSVPADLVSLGYLLWFMGLEEKTIGPLAERLGFTADLTKSLRAAARLKKDLPVLLNAKPSVWAERLDRVPPLAVYAAYLVSRQAPLKEYLAVWRNLKPTLTGEDLKSRGLTPGPEFKRILSRLRAAWVDGEVGSAKQEKKLLEKLIEGK
jgi:tRNA nucleotidyltransferase (CCA-adding enzyme)